MKALSQELFHLITVHEPLWGNFYYPYFMGVETGADIY